MKPKLELVKDSTRSSIEQALCNRIADAFKEMGNKSAKQGFSKDAEVYYGLAKFIRTFLEREENV